MKRPSGVPELQLASQAVANGCGKRLIARSQVSTVTSACGNPHRDARGAGFGLLRSRLRTDRSAAVLRLQLGRAGIGGSAARATRGGADRAGLSARLVALNVRAAAVGDAGALAAHVPVDFPAQS